jgi:hypothetical protein
VELEPRLVVDDHHIDNVGFVVGFHPCWVLVCLFVCLSVSLSFGFGFGLVIACRSLEIALEYERVYGYRHRHGCLSHVACRSSHVAARMSQRSHVAARMSQLACRSSHVAARMSHPASHPSSCLSHHLIASLAPLLPPPLSSASSYLVLSPPKVELKEGRSARAHPSQPSPIQLIRPGLTAPFNSSPIAI